MPLFNRRRWPAPSPFLSAALTGAYVGIALQMALGLSTESLPDWSEIWAVPLVLFLYGLFALPFVSLGLALCGIPAARLLHRWRDRPWMGLVAAVSGALAGKLAYYAVDHLLFFGNYRLWSIEPLDLGLCYGIPTGLAWWWFKRND
ncbi:hypothetical protein ACCC88_22155 [Sphingomonas sp. Sphisp140]|uniref:hypothetical protein n=1 Tax=unclassified Sphingomonas TaxID=196159 RepID=UPI0039AF70B1